MEIKISNKFVRIESKGIFFASNEGYSSFEETYMRIYKKTLIKEFLLIKSTKDLVGLIDLNERLIEYSNIKPEYDDQIENIKLAINSILNKIQNTISCEDSVKKEKKMKTKLEEKSVNEIYELMVDKIAQVPSAADVREWQGINLELLEFINEVGYHRLFEEPLMVLSCILLFGIAEDYEVGYNLAEPIFNNIRNRKGFNSIWEVKLFMRVSFLLYKDFSELKELTKYGFDFIESSDNAFIYEKSGLIINTMHALVKMTQEEYLENESEVKKLFEDLYSMLMNIKEKYRIEFFIYNADKLYEEFKNGEKVSEEAFIENHKKIYEKFSHDLNSHIAKLHNEEIFKDLHSSLKKLKLKLGGKL